MLIYLWRGLSIRTRFCVVLCPSIAIVHSAPSLESPLSVWATISYFNQLRTQTSTLCLLTGILQLEEFAMRQCV